VSTYALTDSWTMTRRELAHWARQPVRVLVGLVFPVMLLLMFGYLVGGGGTSRGTTSTIWSRGCSR
jgi:ABC-2 type transport system permease protein